MLIIKFKNILFGQIMGESFKGGVEWGRINEFIFKNSK